MTTLYIVRHGQYSSPTPVIPFRLPGFHLSDEGRKQAECLSKFLKDKSITAVFTSPMERTQETAAILAKPHGLIPISDDRLLEVRSPVQGMTVAQIEAIHTWDWSLYESDWYHRHGGETLDELFARVHAVSEEILRDYAGQSVILVTHGDPIMVLAAGYMGLPRTAQALLTLPYVSMAGGYWIEFEAGFEPKVYPIVAT